MLNQKHVTAPSLPIKALVGKADPAGYRGAAIKPTPLLIPSYGPPAPCLCCRRPFPTPVDEVFAVSNVWREIHLGQICETILYYLAEVMPDGDGVLDVKHDAKLWAKDNGVIGDIDNIIAAAFVRLHRSHAIKFGRAGWWIKITTLGHLVHRRIKAGERIEW